MATTATASSTARCAWQRMLGSSLITTTTNTNTWNNAAYWSIRNNSCYRWYVSRAHPQPKPVYGIQAALQQVLADIQQRQQKRAVNWERFRAQREKQRGVKVSFLVDICIYIYIYIVILKMCSIIQSLMMNEWMVLIVVVLLAVVAIIIV